MPQMGRNAHWWNTHSSQDQRQEISKVIICLLELSKNELFYEEKHPAIVIETTSRTLKILMKDVANKTVIFYGLNLLSQILAMCNSDSAVNLVQVMELSKNILFSHVFQNIHLSAMFLLRCVLRLKEFKSQEELLLVHNVLRLLSQLEKNNKKKFNNHIKLVNDLMLFSLRLTSSDLNHPLSKKCEVLVWALLQSSVVFFIQRVQVKKCHAGSVKKHLRFLVGVFEYFDLEMVVRLSNMLASKGFLTLLPLINSHFNEETISGFGMSLLSQMLAVLANTKLKLSSLENQLVSDGLLCLPVDANKWPLLLGRTKLPSKIYHAVIFYLYFDFLCAKSFDKAPIYLPVLCTFIKSQNSSLSPSMLKAVWFLFAVSLLSKQDGRRESKRREESANGILVRWLQTVPLSTVYTHHPALLFWTFSTYITNRTLQMNLMTLWLKAKDEPTMKQTKEFVLKNRKAACCILDVLLDCPSETISQAMDILKTVLMRDKNQGLLDSSDSIWPNLPRTLSLLTTPLQENKASNVSCVLFLACKVVPSSPDSVLLLRISHQLLVLLRRPIKDLALSTVLHAQLFKLATILVIKMNQAKDYRVLESFLQDEVLLRALLTSLSSENSIVVLPALRLISQLQYFQKLFSIKTKSCMYLSGATLLKLMSSPLAQNKFASLNLFSLLHATNNLSPIVALSTDTADHILQTIYLDFQMMTLKTNKSWECQTLLLDFCEANNPKMELHLLTQPWNCSVIQLAISKNNMNCSEVLMVLSDWLNRLLLRDVVTPHSYTRALCQDRLSSTLTQVAKEVLHKFHCDNNLASLYVDIASKIAQIGVNVPQQVYQSLEEKILKNYIIW